MSTDLDQSGHGYQQVKTWLGPSLGWAMTQVGPAVNITTAGIYTVQPGDSVLLVNVSGNVQINLPDVVAWVQQTANQPATGFNRSITIKDEGGFATNNPILVQAFGTQKIDGLTSQGRISTNRGAARVIPLQDLSGWTMESYSATVGGGGPSAPPGAAPPLGLNAPTNTYVMLYNTADFQIQNIVEFWLQNNLLLRGTPSVQTPPSVTDNSNNIATTGWVRSNIPNPPINSALPPMTLAGTVIELLYDLTMFQLLPSNQLGIANNAAFPGSPTIGATPPITDNTNKIASTNWVQSFAQPLDADLTSLAGAMGTNTIYYRSGVGTWTPVTIGAGMTFTGGTLSSTGGGGGGGNVSNVGTPVNGQLAQWTSATTIQGIAPSSLGFAPIASPVFTGNPTGPTPATNDNSLSLATTAYVQANLGNFQPLDGDLTAIAALTGTNNIYYRSGVNTWAPVTFSGLSFSGGVLTVTAGGGNVSNSGSPLGGQYAKWVDATHVQGVSVGTVLTDIGAQPLDADLSAIAALTGTNVIYYRSAADTWSPVTIGSGLSFTSGTLQATVGGGNISNSGTPASGQWAQFTDATHIQGIATASMPFVQKAGDTMTGPLQITMSGPFLLLNSTATGNTAAINYYRSGLARWAAYMDGATESGGNIGSNYVISRYNDAGTVIDSPFVIARNTGAFQLNGTITSNLAAPNMVLNANTTGTSAFYGFYRSNLPRWQWGMTTDPETGSNAGSNWGLSRYTDAGALIDSPIAINRATGAVFANIPLPTYQIFASGSGTYTSPAGCRRIKVRMVGGGGGGASNTPGGVGGNTGFSGAVCAGGQGGLANGNPAAGGAGGATIGGTILNVPGGAGAVGSLSQASVMSGIGGTGGNSIMGLGGVGSYNGPGFAAGNFGAGGGGGAALIAGGTAVSGSGGGGGQYQELILAPGSYAYTVGTAGNGAAAGTNTAAGANGSVGTILVEEFY